MAGPSQTGELYQGRPCKHCGGTEKRRGKCPPCDLARLVRRRAVPGYYEHHKQYVRSYTSRNADAVRAKDQRWRQANWALVKNAKFRRRSRERAAEGFFLKLHTDAILAAQHFTCAYCDAITDLQLDHVIPLSRGGSNYPWNLQWLCAFHNVSKGSRTDAEYRVLTGLPIEAPISMRLWIAIFAA